MHSGRVRVSIQLRSNYLRRDFLKWMLLFPRLYVGFARFPGVLVVKKPSYFLSAVALSLFIVTNAFSQAPATVAKTGPANPLSAPKTSKPVTVENIEQDVAEALSIIESNHVVGKKISYNDVF